MVGFLFACHGAMKLFGVFGGATGHGGTVPVGTWPTWWAGVIELFGGSLVAAGLATRPVAFLCSGEMAYAYFTVHQPTGLFPIENKGEAAALFSWAFLLLTVFGPGRWSLDDRIASSLRRRMPEHAEAAGRGHHRR